MVSADLITPDAQEPAREAAYVQPVGFRGKPRRTWPQRLLMLAAVMVSAACFAAAFVFWQASVVLSEIPRISVGPDVLAQGGDPGEPVNILLVGVDSSEGLDPDDPVRAGRETEDEARGIVRPDTVLVARLDPATGTASVLSLPRDLIVEVEGGTTTRLNATQAVGGIGSLISAIDSNLEIPINHFVQVDFAGFSDIVDIVGGVPVYFPFPTRDLGSGLAIAESGCFNLDGSESLSYVRARSLEELIEDEWVELVAVSPDLARIERQQEFLVLTTEEILAVGRRDLSRIGSFIEAGSQAVQLDEELTPGDMADLAAAFSDFDTESLEIATLPVGASFSETGVYLGEQLLTEGSSDLLARFQGRDDGVRPPEVELEVRSTESRHADELAERGFLAASVDADLVEASTIRFDPADEDRALLVGRYLETAPRFVVEDGAVLRLEVGPDFSGVRVFPRAETDVAPALATALADAAAGVPGGSGVTAGETAPTSTVETDGLDDDGVDGQAGETSVPAFATEDENDLPSSTEAELIDPPVADQVTPNPPSTVVRGRPPEGIGCTSTGG